MLHCNCTISDSHVCTVACIQFPEETNLIVWVQNYIQVGYLRCTIIVLLVN